MGIKSTLRSSSVSPGVASSSSRPSRSRRSRDPPEDVQKRAPFVSLHLLSLLRSREQQRNHRVRLEFLLGESLEAWVLRDLLLIHVPSSSTSVMVYKIPPMAMVYAYSANRLL